MSKKYSSPNFNERVGCASPSMVIVHYTGMESAKAALDRLCDPVAEVSAHYLVDEGGTLEQLVEDDKRAWHAGVSSWGDVEDVNSHSIGIELVNPGHEFGYRPFPEEQIAVLSALCKRLMAVHNIMPEAILGHSDIAPGRKQDPGEFFPWARLAVEGVGLWPAPDEMDREAGLDIVDNESVQAELLGLFGYKVANNLNEVIAAFHRRFYPEMFEGGNDPEALNEAGAAKLLSLLRLSHKA